MLKKCTFMGLFFLWGILSLVMAQSVPELTGRVIDLANLLSPETEDTLTQLLKAHEDSTTNQIAVLTIPSLEGEILEAYSINVAQTWQLGQAEKDNGVLLLIARDDRKIRIEVGQGLEGTLTDYLAGRIIDDEMVPLFRNDDFEGGIVAGATAIIGSLEGTYSAQQNFTETRDTVSRVFTYGILSIIGIFFLGGLFRSVLNPWWVSLLNNLVTLPFMAFPLYIFTEDTTLVFVVLGIYLVLYLFAFIYVRFNPTWIARRKRWQSGKSIQLGPFTVSGYSPSSGSSGSGWSSGGGWSGGGGSFGGGGASGGW